MSRQFQQFSSQAAGIDLGSVEHFVAVPKELCRDEDHIQSFFGHTVGLEQMAAWLKKCRIQKVAMESTGVYWVPVYDLLEQHGFDVTLVHANHIKQVPGRKSNVRDAEWIQQLHAHGLLPKCFRPSLEIVDLRNLYRWRETLIQEACRSIQHMQKALDQMNILVHRAVTDISGKTGTAIIEAILDGERSAKKLAELRDKRCKKTAQEIAEALSGNYRESYLVQLKQAYADYKFKKLQMGELDIEIEKMLQAMKPEEGPEEPLGPKRGTKQKQGNEPGFNLRSYLFQIIGVDMTQIEGMQALSVLKILSEVGTDLKKSFPTVKRFSSWLTLCPGCRITGGKNKSGRTRKSNNRAAAAFRMAAQSLCRSKGPLGQLYRRLKRRKDTAQVVTAMAHKLARIFYAMATKKTPYNPTVYREREEKRNERKFRHLVRKANELGFEMVPTDWLQKNHEALLQKNQQPDVAAVT